MKLGTFMLMVFLAAAAHPALSQQAKEPLTQGQVLDLVKFGISTADLVNKIQTLGIDFDPTDAYVAALRQAGAQEAVINALNQARPNQLKPLTKRQVGKLLTGGVSSERATMLVKQYGVTFVPDDDYLRALRLAGGDDALIAALREAGKAVGAHLSVQTSPGAEVFLDGDSQGQADAQGNLAIRASAGSHMLKVTLAGKKNFEEPVNMAAGKVESVNAALTGLAGSVKVQTSPGAMVFVDGASRGPAGAGGEMVVSELDAGVHDLRISAQGKQEFRQSVTVVAGQESRVEAGLESLGPTPGQIRENSKDGLKYVWIPPGTFMMGCSPHDSQCFEDEKPAHQVTITRGYWIGQTLVTVGSFKRFAAAAGRPMPVAPNSNMGWTKDKMPIVNLSWYDAQAYCQWLGGRLPTEAEWEYAARGGSTEARYGNLDESAWYAGNSAHQVHDVAQLSANGFGLFDVLGNVWEWVNDWYDGQYYQHSPAQDPEGPASGKDRVLRGGGWSFDRQFVRVSYRVINYTPASRSESTGVRCGGEILGSP